MTQNNFVGRQEEMARLSALWDRGLASLVVVRGRRRIGKSRLIAEFAGKERFLTFSGLPHSAGTTAQDQRDVFAQQLGQQIGLQGVGAEDWATLFSILARYTAQGRVTILFDEISWMGSEDHLFLGKLKNAWDLEFQKNPQLMLVLCGSVSTWIEKNIIQSTGFFGRISLFLTLEELPLRDCHKLLLTRGFRRSLSEELQILAVTGGIPWYLEHIRSKCGAEENIHELCFRKEGLLFNEFERIFHDLFEKRSEIYRPIVEALAEGPMELNEICDKCHYAKSGTLTEYLADLIASGFLHRDYTWSIKSGEPSRLSHYRLSDNYLRFYLKNIAPHRDRILRDASPPNHWRWHAMIGLSFENLVLKNRKAIWRQLGVRPEDIVADNPYFQRQTKNKRGCQIDYLIQTRFNTLFACEIKHTMQPLTTAVIDEMKEKLGRLSLPKRFSCWPVLIHVNGVQESVLEQNYFSSIIDFSDLMQ